MLKTSCRYTVTVHRRDQTMTKIVNDDSFTIGRSMDCTIPLTEDSISRVHVVVHRRQEQIWIEDKGSSNGTFVNNVRIAQNSLVNVVPTDRIRIGKSDYVLSISLIIEEQEESGLGRHPKADETEVLQTPATPKKEKESPKMVTSVPAPEAEAKKEVRQQSPKFAPKELFPKEFMPKEKEKENEEPIKYQEPLAAPKAKATNFATTPEPVTPKATPQATPQAMAHSVVQKLDQPAPTESDPNRFESEKLLHEARSKAAQIVYEAELKAEKRAQSIYVEARERSAQADQYYQKKVLEAHKEVDRVLLSFQNQGQELLVQARQFAQEIREEVDVFAQGLREKARREAEQIEFDAREEAESLKKEAYEKARSKAEIEAEDLVVSANAESQDILNFAKQAADEMLSKARNEMEDELKDLKALVDDKKKQLHAVKKEQEENNIKALGEKEEIEGKIEELNSALATLKADFEGAQRELAKTRFEEAELRDKIQDQKKSTQELEHQIGQLYGDTKTLERKNKELQDQTGHFTLDIKALEDKKRMMDVELMQQKQQMKDRVDKEHQSVIKDSEERIQEAQLEMSKRLQILEREMLEEIMGRKENLVRDIIIVIETRIAKVLEPAKWDQVSSTIFEGISETIEGKAVTFSESSKTPKQSASLQRKKKKENLRWLTGGITAGIAVCLLGVQGYNRIQNDRNPMRTIANEDARKRKEDLERRKFNPAQVSDVKDTYTDAVIYTSGFVAAYQDADFQQKLYKAASAYLLKTWRVDEDKSIQVLSMSSALIKELNDKRQGIHPDYVKDGIAKMRSLEKESTDRMKAVLGSEVRLESYRRFEKKFFETEVLKK
jgi:pSer/pThr/pTyr-binding forkhead associated (FHA) protein